jgi:hypothetical protein
LIHMLSGSLTGLGVFAVFNYTSQVIEP